MNVVPHCLISSDSLKNGFASSLVLGILQSHVILINARTQQQLLPDDVVSLDRPVKRNHQRDTSHDLGEIGGYPIAEA